MSQTLFVSDKDTAWLTKGPYIHDIKDAARAALEWPLLIEDWATDAIKRAMVNVIDHMKQDGSDTDDRCPLPAYALPRVRAAMKHIHAIDRKCERDIERHKPKKGKFA